MSMFDLNETFEIEVIKTNIGTFPRLDCSILEITQTIYKSKSHARQAQ